MECLRRQYFSLYPVYLLSLPPLERIAKEENQTFLIDRLLGGELKDVQPENGYRRTFWRRILGSLEEGVRLIGGEAEVEEVFYEVVSGLMISQGSSDDVPQASFKTFIYDSPPWSGEDERHITLLEEQVAVQSGTTGLRTWTASLHLAHQILHDPSILLPPAASPPCDDRSSANMGTIPPTIELGAGTGFLSILLSQLGSDVLTTDLGDGGDLTEEESELKVLSDSGDIEDREIEEANGMRVTPLKRLKGNILLNDNDQKNMAKVKHLDWMESISSPSNVDWSLFAFTSSGERRTIVGADIIYNPDLIPPLVATIHNLLSSSPPPSSGSTSSEKVPNTKGIAVISATIRNEETFNTFLKACREYGLECTVIKNLLEQTTFWDSALDRGTRVEVLRITLSG